MIELQIVKIDKFNNFTLQGGGNQYVLTLEFYDMPKPEKGDILILPEEWLDRRSPNFVGFMCFEPSAEKASKCEVIGLHTKTQDYVLKRVYG